ncbi:hypothetical protein ABMA27_011028 [Loxostege sticticalis]|uniref:BPTI/Kunitz inhibitor domain-containing protein n=1 Tax=Loxostege sticticalis TaxID=481309 RepID=A0ABR3H320_LOXSC
MSSEAQQHFFYLKILNFFGLHLNAFILLMLLILVTRNYFVTKYNSDPACKQPIEPGPCYGYFEVYGYNTTTEKCELFIYGGCEGNDNRYETIGECQQACEYDC